MGKEQAPSTALSEWHKKRLKQLLNDAAPEKKYPLTWEFHPAFGRAVLNAEDIIKMFEDNVGEWEKVKLDEASAWGRDAMDVVTTKAQRKRDELFLLRQSIFTCLRLTADMAETVTSFDHQLELIRDRALHPNKTIAEIHSMLRTLIERGESLTYRQVEEYLESKIPNK
jgi:hypothetical protein